MELEGYELTMRMTELALELRKHGQHASADLEVLPRRDAEEMIPAEFRESGVKDYGPPHSTWNDVLDAWDEDEFALDPTRLTLVCGTAGFDGTQFKGLLAERFDIQINKTSRNTILVQTNINNTRSDVALLIKALADISREIEQRLHEGGKRRARPVRCARQVADGRRARPAELQPLPRCVPRQPEERAATRATCARRSSRAYDEADCEHIKLASKDDRRAPEERAADGLGELRDPVSAGLPDHGARAR